MRAIWYEQAGAASSVLQLGELPKPVPQPGEVCVRVYASGVNPSDVKARSGARGPVGYPLVIPHSDGAGVIDSVGEGVDTARIGQRVWLWNAAWKRQFGTCAEYVALPEVQAVPLDPDCSFSAGACLGIPASTACHAVFCDGPVTGQTVLVTGGAGAVGHYAIQLARWGGARVVATVSGPEKAAHAENAGADAIVYYREGDTVEAIRRASGGAGVDRIIEVELGGNLHVSNAVLKPSGTIVAYGSMAAPTPELPFYPMMFNGVTLRLMLVYLLQGSARERVTSYLTRAIQARQLKHAIAAEFPLERSAAAHELVESGQAIGNVVITV